MIDSAAFRAAMIAAPSAPVLGYGLSMGVLQAAVGLVCGVAFGVVRWVFGDAAGWEFLGVLFLGLLVLQRIYRSRLRELADLIQQLPRRERKRFRRSLDPETAEDLRQLERNDVAR